MPVDAGAFFRYTTPKGGMEMEFAEYFPVWSKLTDRQQGLVEQNLHRTTFKAGTVVHNGSLDCMGLIVVRTGQLRAYIFSDEGREITIYRLFDHDICLFSASCMMRSIQFDIIIEAEKDTDVWVIPPHVFGKLMEESVAVSNYVNELMSTRFSDVMWLMEQVMWKRFDQRLADFLVEESRLEGSPVLKMTHEKIANHLGTAREVVTRMLRYFQSENMVKLTRGAVELTDIKRLQSL